MRALRVVGIADDGAVILEDSARRERFTVPADEQLRAAARGDVARFGQIAIEVESQLRPREIQARIRAGASVEQVAAAAGVPVPKIERFAYPVLLERTRTAELAQAAHPIREDGPDLRTLLETVAHTFGLRGQDHTDAAWDSWKGEDGKWVVALSWHSGHSAIRAHWTFQPGAHGGTVTALDQHAIDLVEGRPQQPLRPVGPVIDMQRGEETPGQHETVRAAVNGEAPARSRADQQRRSATHAGGQEPTRRAGREPVTARAEPAAGATDGEAASAREQQAGARPAGRPTDPKPGDSQAPATAEPDDADAPDESAQDDAPAAEAKAAGEAEDTPEAKEAGDAAAPAKRTKKGKPVMPSWDEVLLGVRGQQQR